MATLDKWWNIYKKDNTIIRGNPTVAFKLKGNLDQTIIIFGESHTANEYCDNKEVFLKDMFKLLMDTPKCAMIDVILELSQSSYNLINQNDTKNISQVARLMQLLHHWKIYYLTEKDKGKRNDCIIDLHYANILRLNNSIIKLCKCPLNKIKDDFLYEKEELVEKLFLITNKKDAISISSQYENLSLEQKQKLDSLILNDFYKKTEKCLNTILNLDENSDPQKIQEEMICVYNIGIDLIDNYTLITILSKNDTHKKNVFVYEGLLHTIKVIEYLTTFFNYKIQDITHSLSHGCCQFLEQSNINQNIESINQVLKNNESPYVEEIVQKSLKRITNACNIISETS